MFLISHNEIKHRNPTDIFSANKTKQKGSFWNLELSHASFIQNDVPKQSMAMY